MNIYKYALADFDHGTTNNITAPEGARFLHLGLDPGGVLCVWLAVLPQEPMQNHEILCLGTGFDADNVPPYYYGTFKQGPFMWHFFGEMPPYNHGVTDPSFFEL